MKNQLIRIQIIWKRFLIWLIKAEMMSMDNDVQDGVLLFKDCKGTYARMNDLKEKYENEIIRLTKILEK